MFHQNDFIYINENCFDIWDFKIYAYGWLCVIVLKSRVALSTQEIVQFELLIFRCFSFNVSKFFLQLCTLLIRNKFWQITIILKHRATGIRKKLFSVSKTIMVDKKKLRFVKRQELVNKLFEIFIVVCLRRHNCFCLSDSCCLTGQNKKLE